MKPENRKRILGSLGKEPLADIARELGMTENSVRRFVEKEKARASGAQRAPAARPSADGAGPSVASSRPFSSVARLAAVAVLGTLVYASAIGGAFVWDDMNLVRKNTYITDARHWRGILTEDIGAGSGVHYKTYRPLQILTYALDHKLWKFDARGYHATNVLWHVLSAFAVYALVLLLFGSPWTAFLTAALFAVHPVHTEAVAYVAGRADPLAAFFTLMALVAYLKASRVSAGPGRAGWILAALTGYTAALASKEYALVFLLLAPLCDVRSEGRVRWKAWVPFAALSAAYTAARFTILRFPGTAADAAEIVPLSFAERLPGFFAAFFGYVRILLFPSELHMEYGAKRFSFADPEAVLGLALFAGLAAAAFAVRRRDRLPLFAFAWFSLALLPQSNLFPINAYMAEHWLYVPSIGFFLWLADRAAAFGRRAPRPAAAAAAAVLLLYGGVTFRQNGYWREPLAFYDRTLRYAPDSARLHYNKGLYLEGTGDAVAAAAAYAKATEADAQYTAAFINMGNVRMERGDAAGALEAYTRALNVRPSAGTLKNIGGVHASLKDYGKAAESYRRALELDPGSAEIRNDLGTVYWASGSFEEAVTCFREAMERDPSFALPRYNLAMIYRKTGQLGEAKRFYQEARALRPALRVVPELEDEGVTS